jgi:hypothetical protein
MEHLINKVKIIWKELVCNEKVKELGEKAFDEKIMSYGTDWLELINYVLAWLKTFRN